MKKVLLKTSVLVLAVIVFTLIFRPIGVRFDEWVMARLQHVYKNEEHFLYQWAEFVTYAGDANTFIILAIAMIMFLIVKKKYKLSFTFSFIFIGGVLVNTALKYVIGRPRPDGQVLYTDFIPETVQWISYSFPSGHSTRAVLLAIGFTVLIARFTALKSGRKWFLYVLIWLIACFTLASRVILGVHYPTDVLMALVYMMIWSLIILRLHEVIFKSE